MATAEKLILPQKSDLHVILECPLCLHTMQSPHILKECFHSFCQTCIKEVPKKNGEEDNSTGWDCPVCCTFTKEADVKPNEFIEKLLKMNNKEDAATDQSITNCEHCLSENSAKWKCEECKMCLCDICKAGHLKIPLLKGHTIINLESTNKQAEKVVDELAFCSLHDRLLDCNCETCERAICFDCRTDKHKEHRVEKIGEALERLLHKLNYKSGILKKQFAVTEHQIANIRKVIEETKQSYIACKAEMDTRLAEAIVKLKATNEEMKAELDAKQEVALVLLEKVKVSLEGKLSQGKHLYSLVNVTTENANNTSLLLELQDGLQAKVQKYTDSCKSIKVEAPVLRHKKLFTFLTTSQSQERNFLGEIHQSMNTREIACEVPHLSVSFTDIFDNNFQVETNIELKGYPNRLAYIHGKIWVAQENLGNILIYNISGELEETFECYQPLVIRQAYNGDLIIAGPQGIYVQAYLNSKCRQIAAGQVADMAVHGDKIFILDTLTRGTIRQFEYVHKPELIPNTTEATNWKQTTSFPVGNNIAAKSTVLVDQNGILVSSSKNDYFTKYAFSGKSVNTFKSNVVSNQLCGTDRDGNILIARYNQHFLTLTDKDFNVIKDFILKDQIKCPRDVIIDDNKNIWVLQGEKYYPHRLTMFKQN